SIVFTIFRVFFSSSSFFIFSFFFSSRRRHTRFSRDWSSDVCSSDLSLREPRNGRCELRERVRLSSRRRKSRVGVLRRHIPQLLRHLRQAITQHHTHARRIRRTTTPRTIRMPRKDNQIFLRGIDRLSGRRVVLHDPQRVQRQSLIASKRRRPHPQQINMRLRRLAREPLHRRRVPVLVRLKHLDPRHDRRP